MWYNLLLFKYIYLRKMENVNDYDSLLSNYKKLQIELEAANQALYDSRRLLKNAQTIEFEYQEEIKVLQTQGTIEQQELQVRIQQLEEVNSNLKSSHNERIQYLERELLTKETEIDNLKKEIEDITKIANLEKPITNEKLSDEICQLKEENLTLIEQVTELEESLKLYENENLVAQEKIKQLEKNLENHEEILKTKKEECDEAKILIQNLRDDVLCMKSELDSMKSKPLDDQSKGNSLFAEVDDRRLQLQKNMNMMKTQYIEMKRERGSLLKQIAKLRNANATLIAQREEEVTGRKCDADMIVESYKDQIKTLNEVIESYEKELKEKNNFDSSSSDVIKFFDNIVAKKTAENEDLRKKLQARSLNYTTLSYDLAEANKQNRKANLEILQLKNEIINLEVKIQEVKLGKIGDKESVHANLPKPIVKNISQDVNKENDGTNKKVQFSPGTEEPHVTDRSKYKKGAKILTSKPIHYS